MPRKKDALNGVLQYFETALYNEAVVTLKVANRIMAQRGTQQTADVAPLESTKAKPKKRTVRKPKATPAAASSTQPTLN